MRVLDLEAAVLTDAAAFFLDFTVAGIGASVGFGSSFSGFPVFLVAVITVCSGVSARGCVEGLGLGVNLRWL